MGECGVAAGIRSYVRRVFSSAGTWRSEVMSGSFLDRVSTSFFETGTCLHLKLAASVRLADG